MPNAFTVATAAHNFPANNLIKSPADEEGVISEWGGRGGDIKLFGGVFFEFGLKRLQHKQHKRFESVSWGEN